MLNISVSWSFPTLCPQTHNNIAVGISRETPVSKLFPLGPLFPHTCCLPQRTRADGET